MSIIYNIKQKTQADCNGQEAGRIETRRISIGGLSTEFDYNYYKFDRENLDIGNNDIIKFGYCCNSVKGKDYPIFIGYPGQASGDLPIEVQFYPGKEGMYEFQPETWIIKDDNTGDIDTYEGTVQAIEYILIPMGFSFVLDYCFAK